jgi:hypothetical protein
VTMKRTLNEVSVPITTMIELRKQNQQITALRFRIDPAGEIVAGSVDSLYKPLRVAAAQ